MLHTLGNFPYMFDYWADPVAHLLLLKSFIPFHIFTELGPVRAALIAAAQPEVVIEKNGDEFTVTSSTLRKSFGFKFIPGR